MDFREIAYDSSAYSQSLELREKILRIPLGKTLSTADRLGEQRQMHFGLFDKEQLLACVIIKPIAAGSSAKLRQMAVSARAQRRGLGRQLIFEVENTLQTLGYVQIELSSRKTAIGFYQSMSYQTTGDFFLEQDIDHIKMQKRLN